MSKTSTARHRKAARPLNSLVGASPMVRRSLAVAASSGLALTVVASGAAASGTSAQAANSAGTLKSASVTTVALDAREAVTTNAALDVARVTIVNLVPVFSAPYRGFVSSCQLRNCSCDLPPVTMIYSTFRTKRRRRSPTYVVA